MPKGKGKTTHAVIAIDYFTKWAKAETLTTTTASKVEAINKLLKRTLKKKLGAKKGAWSELLPEVLWAYHCTQCTSTGETPYSLAFGTKAISPFEANITMRRVDHYTPQ
ncbi:hypothetical protein L3X38_041944 [Prunus dulcis]|uniref:Reverse transcriptase domain-containing protein n=1 Tax=Prunus dulcis TaxID=3755 RepID=A0AAD4UTY1_PRUDU|nr:hypothetical protein L3X38_041944 [Prunus dulcis]